MFCAYAGVSGHGKLSLDAKAAFSRDRKLVLGRKAGVFREGKLLLDTKTSFSDDNETRVLAFFFKVLASDPMNDSPSP
ncbi:MAG: hypothetical protein JWM68_2776 [Verrucomicrobiales bacterium]|nr:hypothetical protein [Verrucomicrobiales bacterium]